MRRIRPHVSRPRAELLEERTLLATLIALVDTGVDQDSINQNYLDTAGAYNAVTGLTGMSNVEYTYGHGSLVSDFIAQEIQSTSSLSGQSPSVEILPQSRLHREALTFPLSQFRRYAPVPRVPRAISPRHPQQVPFESL
jgi:hypothetical protein